MKKFNLLLAGILFTLLSCSSQKQNGKSIAVFVPGIMADSPVYAMLAEGVTKAVDEFNLSKADAEKVSCYILEAGTNQAEWGTKLLALAAEQKYDVIISSNPSLPDLAVPILEAYPNQKFILLDAEYSGNSNIYTACYNQYEQSYLTGLIAGKMSKTGKVALVAAQEYPVMNNVIYPYFEKGAAESNATCEFRIVGNWYDANKSAVITDSLINEGVDVILPICGGAAQGVINSAVNGGAYITWFDNNGFARAPGTIISSTIMKQDVMSTLATQNYLNDKTKWGAAEMYGIRDGFIDFVQDDPLYISAVPEDIRNEMAAAIADLKSGKLVISRYIF